MAVKKHFYFVQATIISDLLCLDSITNASFIDKAEFHMYSRVH